MNVFFDRLFHLPPRTTRDLTYVRSLDALLGCPHESFISLHVAGTNGKGSVSTKLAKALEASGKKVGLYTSPHIWDVCERIQIDGRNILKERLYEILKKILALPHEGLSLFDLLTAASFLYFQEEKVDYAVIEAGIGGRYDATNVIMPQLAVITSIGYDHMDLLGPSLEDIAREKEGIVKAGVPLIVGPSAAPFFPYAIASDPACFFDLENQGVAKKALEWLQIDPFAIEQGLPYRPPCRFERKSYQGCEVILDVAHNRDGFMKLIEALRLYFPSRPYHFLVAFSKSKDWRACLDLIRNEAVQITAIKTGKKRLEETEVLQSYAPEIGVGESLLQSLKPDCLNVICGSFYLFHNEQTGGIGTLW